MIVATLQVVGTLVVLGLLIRLGVEILAAVSERVDRFRDWVKGR